MSAVLRVRRASCAAAAFLALTSAAASASAQVIGGANWPVERPPRPLPARPMAFPPYELRTLPNGLQVLVIPHHEQPSVSMRLVIKAGNAQSPTNRPGVAQMVAALLDQGTKTRSAEGIADLVESSGGLIGSGAGDELSFISAGVIKDKFDTVMALMADMIEHPAFDQKELDHQKQQALSGMQVNYDDPDFVAGVVFNRLVYGFHPYGRPGNGTPESIAALTRDDVVAFHKAWFAPNNAILALVGDLTADELFAGAEKAFGTWAKHDLPAQTLAAPPPPTRRIVVIDKPGAVQTEIRAGHLTLARTSEDWLKLEVLIRVLGGEGANRLQDELRTTRGLTYAASADLHALKTSGSFMAQTSTRTEATAEALRVMVDEMWRLQREPVPGGTLRGVKDYFEGSFPLSVETPSSIALQVLGYMFYGLSLKDLEQLREKVEAVSVPDLQAVAREWIKPDRLSIVLVGDASKFMPQLKAQGFDSIEVIPISQLDLNSPTLRKGGGQSAAAAGGQFPVASNQSQVASGQSQVASNQSRVASGQSQVASNQSQVARKQPPVPSSQSGDQSSRQAPVASEAGAVELVRKIAEAKGGLATLRGVKTVDVSAAVTIAGDGAPQKIQTRNLVAYPGKFRVEADTPNGHIVQVFDGRAAWVETPAGSMDADASAQADYRASAARDLIPLLVAAADGRVPVEELGPDTVNGVAARTLRFAVADGGPLTMLVDAATFRILELRYATEASPDAPRAVERFDDYRVVGGVQVAFHARVERDGLTIDRVVTSVKFNTELPASLFERKS